MPAALEGSVGGQAGSVERAKVEAPIKASRRVTSGEDWDNASVFSESKQQRDTSKQESKLQIDIFPRQYGVMIDDT
jgi:hypothetical protein